MMDFLNYISTWSVLKWVILVLVAGFIGQFGRMMAEALIAKVRRRRESKQALIGTKPLDTQMVSSMDAGQSSLPDRADTVSDKKKFKALAKARKKEAKINE